MIGRVLMCGDRYWDDDDTIKVVVELLVSRYGIDIAIIHGAARGADKISGYHATRRELTVWSEPAKWSVHNKAAGPIRNRLMLSRYKPHLVIAFHNDLANSRGTRDMVAAATRQGVPVIHVKSSTDLSTKEFTDALPASLCSPSADAGTARKVDTEGHQGESA